MNQITVEELKTLLENKPQNIIVVDVRTKKERDAEYIEGTIHIPLDQIPFQIAEIGKSEKVYFQCAKGGRSASACDILLKTDFPDAYNVMGGIEEWKRKGYSISHL
mgnify:FL=1